MNKSKKVAKLFQDPKVADSVLPDYLSVIDHDAEIRTYNDYCAKKKNKDDNNLLPAEITQQIKIVRDWIDMDVSAYEHEPNTKYKQWNDLYTLDNKETSGKLEDNDLSREYNYGALKEEQKRFEHYANDVKKVYMDIQDDLPTPESQPRLFPSRKTASYYHKAIKAPESQEPTKPTFQFEHHEISAILDAVKFYIDGTKPDKERDKTLGNVFDRLFEKWNKVEPDKIETNKVIK